MLVSFDLDERSRIYECLDRLLGQTGPHKFRGHYILKTIFSCSGHVPASLSIATVLSKTMEWYQSRTVNPPADVHIFLLAWFVCPRPTGIKRWRCLTSVCLTSLAYIQSAGSVYGRPAWLRVLADRARLGLPGSRLPLRASVAGLGGGISWRPPAYSLLFWSWWPDICIEYGPHL